VSGQLFIIDWNVRTHVVGADIDLVVGWIAHCVDAEVLVSLRAKRVDERIPEDADARGFHSPRAKTTSTAGQAADADGEHGGGQCWKNEQGTRDEHSDNPAMRWRRITETMLAEGIDALAVKA